MTILDFHHLTPDQRLELIGELWDSLDPNAIRLTSTQEAELDRRLASFSEDIKHAIDAEILEAELDHRYR